MEPNPFDAMAIVMMERASEVMSELHHRDNKPEDVMSKIAELKAQVDHIVGALLEDWARRGMQIGEKP